MQPRSVANDAATIADREVAVAFRKDWGKRPGAGRGKPQPQQVPLAFGLRPVLISRARVQDRMIVQELNVARHEIHVEPQSGSPANSVNMSSAST
jgi:hypothetical protein